MEMQFEKESFDSAGDICPVCGLKTTYLNKASISMVKKIGHTIHSCSVCNAYYEIIYIPHKIGKLRRDF